MGYSGEHERSEGLLGRALLGCAALLWLAAMFLPLTTRGAGLTLTGHELADLVGSGMFDSVPPWVGVAWYAMPLCAALVLIGLGLEGRRVAIARWSASGLATAAALVSVSFVAGWDPSRMGSGLWAAAAGAACALLAAAIAGAQLVRVRRSARVL